MIVSIPIPQGEKLLITKGQLVDFSTPLLKRKKSNSVVVPITQLLSTKTENIYKLIKKTLGQEIKEGEVLAEEKNLFNTKKYISQISGTLIAIDETEGSVVIESENNEVDEILCFFNGEIADIYESHFDLKVKNSHKVVSKNKVAKLGAPVFYEYKFGKMFSEEDVQDKFLLTLEVDPVDHAKIKTLGAKGVISTKKNPILDVTQIVISNEKDWEHVLSKKFPFIISGVEENTVIFYE